MVRDMRGGKMVEARIFRPVGLGCLYFSPRALED